MNEELMLEKLKELEEGIREIKNMVGRGEFDKSRQLTEENSDAEEIKKELMLMEKIIIVKDAVLCGKVEQQGL